MKIPRSWTDMDGASENQQVPSGTALTMGSIRELLELMEAICRRD